ncbi:hypothetical protein ACTXT7_000721, partial [Hymenolepis weldensis]
PLPLITSTPISSEVFWAYGEFLWSSISAFCSSSSGLIRFTCWKFASAQREVKRIDAGRLATVPAVQE